MTVEILTGRQLDRLGLTEQPSGPVKQCCCTHDTGACGNYFRSYSSVTRSWGGTEFPRQYCYFCMVTRPFCRQKIAQIRKEAEWLMVPVLSRRTDRIAYCAAKLTEWYLNAEQDIFRLSPRCGDADRDACVALLREAFAQGHLTMDDFNGRLDKATAAVSQSDLELLRSDLPDLRPEPPAVVDPVPDDLPRWLTGPYVSLPSFPLLVIIACLIGIFILA